MKRAQAAGIPKHVAAAKAVLARQRFAGSVPVAQLPRLAGQLANASGSLEVDFEAGRDAAGLAWLRGAVQGRLTLTCQRGLHPFDWPCRVDTRLRLVSSEAEEEKAMAEAEAHLVEDDQLPLREIIEDEVLLALPIVPRCDDVDCLKRLK